MYVSQKKVNGPPLQLDLFPLDHDSGRGTLHWEKTSPSIGTSGVGSQRSTGEAIAPFHQVAVSWRSDANKCPASYLSNKDAGGINVSLPNSAVDSNAANLGNLAKKRRLSIKQCAVLEESLRKNRVPEPKEKQALALQLNLRPGQVEVWFQNKRARAKLKKIEGHCEVLKRYNEALAHENIKLRIELEKVKALKLLSPPLSPALGLET